MCQLISNIAGYKNLSIHNNFPFNYQVYFGQTQVNSKIQIHLKGNYFFVLQDLHQYDQFP